MSASRIAKIQIEEIVTITVTVPKIMQEAVLAAINSISDLASSEHSAPVLAIVPEVLPEETIKVTPATIGIPKSRPATPADLERLAQHPAARVMASTSTPATSGRPQPGELAKRAPAVSKRTEFKLGYVKGTPEELKATANRVIEEMDWLIKLMPDPDFVRKGLDAISDKTTGNPNHRALVELSKVQEELNRQEEFYKRQMAAFNGKTALPPTAKAPANNGYTAPRRVLTPEEQAEADAQSAAALAAKKIVIGRPNQQGTVTHRGDAVPGVGGGGSRKVRQGRKGAKK